MTRIKGEMKHQQQLTSVVPIVPITPSLGVVPAVICSHSARQVQCRFTLADGHAMRLLTWPTAPSLGVVLDAIRSHSARQVQCRFTLTDGHAIRLLTCTLLVNASKSES
jgi:hypothetical protein